MSHRRIRIVFLIFLLAVTLFVAAYVSIRQGQLASVFKENFKTALSNATGAKIEIDSIRGNIFSRIIVRGLECDFGIYSITFEKARLEYSLMDIMSGREPVDKGQETVITLERGSVKLNNNTLISKEINGKAVLRKDRVLLEDFNFRLLDIIANRVDGELITGEDVLKLDLSLKSEPLFEKDRALFDEADINFKGPVDNLSIYGKVERRESPDILLNIYLISDNKVLNIGSKIRLDGEEMSLSMDTEIDRSTDIFSSVIMPSEGRIKINGDYTEWPLVKADIVNKHLKLNGYDFSDIIHVKTKVLFENDVFSKMVVDIDTESSVFNFYPIDETEASIWIEGEVARLLYVKIGDTISASGTLGLKPPRELFLKINFGDFDIKRILTILGEGSDAEESVSGLLSGEILIKGPIGNLYTRLGLEAVNGYLGTIKYEKMLINAKGIGPLLRVYDSRIVRPDSFLVMDGVADFREFGTDKFMEDVIISSDEKTIIWEGWDITKTDDEQEFSMRKGLGKNFKVGYKRQMDDETHYDPVKNQDEFQLEYDVDDINGTVEIRAKENEEFVVLKKKYKF